MSGPSFAEIVGPVLELEKLGSGFAFTEGPVWHPAEQHLIFSDMPGDHMRRWSAADGVTTFRRPSNKANGNAYDRLGRMLTCEHATSRVSRTELDGSITVLATHYQGLELNSPNDIVVKSDGGDLTLLAADFGQPNGLCFSRDERQLFVNDTERSHIRVFDVDADGLVSGGAVWAEVTGEGAGGPDGMKIDSAGNVYCCGPGGVHVFAPDASHLGVIAVPEVVANFTWGDSDMQSLFLTASTSLYRVRTRTPGIAAFWAP